MCEKQKHWQKQKETILILIVVNARNRTNLNKAPQCVKCNKTLYVYRKAKP